MRRADRLFQIVQTIRGRRLTTAAHLAQRLEVSERTVYRRAFFTGAQCGRWAPGAKPARPFAAFA
jgi:HTH domain